MNRLPPGFANEQARQQRYLLIAEVSRRLQRCRVAEKLARLQYLPIDDCGWEPPRLDIDRLE